MLRLGYSPGSRWCPCRRWPSLSRQHEYACYSRYGCTDAITSTTVSQLTESAGASVLELEVLVGELGAVDRLAATAVALSEVTALDHKVLDDTVEARASVTETKLLAVLLLAGAESTEVLNGLGDGPGSVSFRRGIASWSG